MRRRRSIGWLFAAVLGVVALSGCSGDDDDDDAGVTTTAVDASASAEADCQGGAFPDDPEFRQALCDFEDAQTRLLRADGEFDPTWAQRSGEAVISYADDRDGALAAVEALTAEVEAAIDAAG